MRALPKRLLIVFFIIYQPLFAQKIISGNIQDTSGQKIAGATVLLRSGAGRPLAYAVTSANGTFIHSFKKEDSTELYLEVSHLSFSKTVVRVSNDKNFYQVILKANDGLKLPEVKVTSPPFQRSGDTLQYRVKAFTTHNDRTIGEVIDRLPGISRNAQGQITYQGRPINRYYIEGLDLLGGRYGIANESIRPDMVETVEVLERHQHVKALKDVVPPNEVALNLKLNTKARNRWSGQAELGTGLPLPLYQASINAMKFSAALQILAFAKANNSGQQIMQQLTDLSVTTLDWQLDQNAEPVLKLPIPVFQHLPPARMLWNITAIPGFNLLTKKDSGQQHRINVQAFTHRQHNEFRSRQQFFFPGDSFLLQENSHWQQNKIGLLATYQAEQNQPNKYQLHDVSLNLILLKEHIQLDGTFPAQQHLNNPLVDLQHRFSSMRKSKKHPLMLRMEANHKWLQTGETLRIAPGVFTELFNNGAPSQSIMQQVPQRHIRHQAKWSVTHTKNTWRPQLFVRTRLIHSHFQSALTQQTERSNDKLPAPFKNDFVLQNASIHFGGAIARNWRRFQMQLELPLHLTHLAQKDSSSTRRNSWILVLPSINSEYKHGDVTLRYTGRFDFTTPAAMENYPGYVLTDYRSLMAYPSDFLVGKTLQNSIGFQFNQPTSGWNVNAAISLLHTRRNQIAATLPAGIFLNQRYLLQTNTQTMTTAVAGAGKYLFAVRSGVQLQMQYHHYRMPVIQNNLFQKLANATLQSSVRIYSKVWTALHLETTGKWGVQTASGTISGQQKPVWWWGQEAKATVFFNTTGLQAGTIMEWGAAYQQFHYPYLFADAYIGYRWKRIDLRLQGTNLFNRTNFTMPLALANANSIQTVQLRPLNLLLTVQFVL